MHMNQFIESTAKAHYRKAAPPDREAAWYDIWREQNFAWTWLWNKIVEVPASFPDGRDGSGGVKRVSLSDYWRWSIGLPGEERLLSDDELSQHGLLVSVAGETYHLIHAPNPRLKVDEEGAPLRILSDIISARGQRIRDEVCKRDEGSKEGLLELNLSGCWLPGSILLDAGTNVPINGAYARLSSCDIERHEFGDLRFENSLFRGPATFQGSVFSGVTHFTGATFSSQIEFMNCEFKGTTKFSGSTIGGTARLFNTTFHKRADFTAVIFSDDGYGSTGFGNVKFFQSANFSAARFHAKADFQNASFNEKSFFAFAVFAKEACFDNVTFTGAAEFESASFSGIASFTGVTFAGKAIFKQAAFKGQPDFFNASMQQAADFSNCTWPNVAIDNAFRNARFHETVDFRCINFRSISALNETKFEVEPIFEDPTGKETHETIFLDSVKRTEKAMSDDHRQRRENEKYEGPSKDSRWAALSGGYRTLKKIAERRGDVLLVQTYYRFEIKARVKRPTIPFWEKVAAGFYGATSDYGSSIARPFFALGVSLIAFATVYLILAAYVKLVDWQNSQAVYSHFLQSLDFSVKNTFRPLSALSTDVPREGDATQFAGKLLNNYGAEFGLLVTAISIVQSLIGIVLAFLLALAVRRRFQIE